MEFDFFHQLAMGQPVGKCPDFFLVSVQGRMNDKASGFIYIYIPYCFILVCFVFSPRHLH
jgi:hypothetical protein